MSVEIVSGTYYKSCIICGWFFKTKKSHLDRRKTCSTACSGFRKKTIYKGSQNPNYGNRGEKNPIYKGVFISSYGYRHIHKPNHPNSDSDGYILEHRYVMSEHLGRPLTSEEIIHHIDEDKLNNDITNLQVMSRGEHTKHHFKDYEIIRCDLGRIKAMVKKGRAIE